MDKELGKQKWWIAGILLLSGIIHSQVLRIWMYQRDDSSVMAKSYLNQLTIEPFFRPLEHLLVILNHSLFGVEQSWFVHACILFAFAIIAISIYRLYIKLFPEASKTFATMAVLLFVSRPQNTSALIDVDVTSQILSIMFSLLFVLYLLNKDEINTTKSYFLGLLISLLALLSKESSFGIILMSPLIIMYNNKQKMKSLLINYSIVILAIIIYYLLNSLVIGEWVSANNKFYRQGTYSSGSPFDVFKNAAMLLAGVFYNGSTLDIFPHIKNAKLIFGSFMTLFMGGFLILSGISLVSNKANSRFNRSVITLLLLFISGMIPMVFLQDVSELYTIMMSGFMSIIVISMMEYYLRNKNIWWKRIILLWLIATSLWGYSGIHQKISLAIAGSNHTRVVYNNLKEQINNNEDNISIYIPKHKDESLYSVYYRHKYEPIMTALELYAAVYNKEYSFTFDSTANKQINYRIKDENGIEYINPDKQQITE